MPIITAQISHKYQIVIPKAVQNPTVILLNDYL